MDFYNFFGLASAGLYAVVKALVLLILAFIVSGIAKKLVGKLLDKGKIKEVLDKADGVADGNSGKGKEYIQQLVYFLVFLLFVPGIFSALGVSSIADPILGFLKTIWGFIPNVIAAVIVLVVGNLIAKLVRQLLIPVFSKLNVDELQKKAGIEVKDSAKLSVTLAYIVYVLILIPVIITALQVLNIAAVSVPAIEMLSIVLNFIPNIVVGILVIAVGIFIGKLAGAIVRQLLASTGADKKVKELAGENADKFVLSDVVGTIVNVVVVIFFVVQGLNVLNLKVLTDIGAAVIGYMPSVLAAVLIFVAALFAASAVDKALAKGGYTQYSVISRIAIMVIAVFMILNQLGIATQIVNAAFILILSALAVAFAIAFGVGGRDFAKKTLDDISKKIEKK